MVWRAGRDSGSGNIAIHSLFTSARISGRWIHTVTRITSSGVAPAAARTVRKFANMWAHCALTSSGILPVLVSVPDTPPVATTFPMRETAGIGLPCPNPSTSNDFLLFIFYSSSFSSGRAFHFARSRSPCFPAANAMGIRMDEQKPRYYHVKNRSKANARQLIPQRLKNSRLPFLLTELYSADPSLPWELTLCDEIRGRTI